MKVTLENNKSSQNDGKAAKVGPSPTGLSSALRDSSNTTAQSLSSDTVPANVINSQWEKDMLNKYDSLFQFPLDNTINDRTMILLILAYQMNAVLCFCEAKDGSIAKVQGIKFVVFLAYGLFFSSLFHTCLKNPATFWIGLDNYF